MQITCAACGGTDLEPGFIRDGGQSSRGYAQWVAGALETGLFGGAKLMGKAMYAVEAFRCRRCSFLNHYAREQS